MGAHISEMKRAKPVYFSSHILAATTWKASMRLSR